MYARRNDYGISVNESAVCERCLTDSDALEASYDWWKNAEDTAQQTDDALYPIDNDDGVCNGCGKKETLCGNSLGNHRCVLKKEHVGICRTISGLSPYEALQMERERK